jgi:GT2 family glycosyltransferase
LVLANQKLDGIGGQTTVGVVVVAYDSGDALDRCLDSLAGEADEIVVVNNGGPLALGRDGVRLVESGGNVGFGGGCNRGVAALTADVVVFLNPDTVVRPGSVRTLARTASEDGIGAAQARLLILARPDELNSSGNVVHVSGIAGPGGYGEPASAHAERRDIAYASGAALAMRTDLFRELGGFTERFFLYQEDLELSWRVWMRGLRVVLEPAADVLHDYVLDRPGRRKEYFLERNRLVFVLTAYSRRLLVLLAPVLLAAELGLLALSVREGWWREKIHGWGWLVRNRSWLRAHRRELQSARRVADRELAALLTPRFELGMVEHPPGSNVFTSLVALWWRGVRVIL